MAKSYAKGLGQHLNRLLALGLSLAATIGFSQAEPSNQDKGTSEKLCILHEDWPRLELLMKVFETEHALDFYGEVKPLAPVVPNRQLHGQLNFALIKGLHQFGRDDFDLWLASNPEPPDEVYFNVLTRHVITPDQVDMVNAFRGALRPLICSDGMEQRDR